MLEFEYQLYEVQPAGGLLQSDNSRCQRSGSDMVPEQLVRFETRKILRLLCVHNWKEISICRAVKMMVRIGLHGCLRKSQTWNFLFNETI
jgi:hypothetical protein